MAPFHTAIRSLSWWMTCSFFVTSLLLSPTEAAEPGQVTIQALLSPQATSYQQHVVTLEGITSLLQVLPSSIGTKGCTPIYGRASFVLNDETGSLAVDVWGTCTPSAVEALPKDGDRVRVTGLVQVLKTESPRDVRVRAMAIQVLESH